jgi:hypothetical protein
VIAGFLTSLIARLKGWAVGALAILAAIGTAFVIGRSKGRQAGQDAAKADKAKSDIAALGEALDAAKERHDVEIEIARQPAGSSADRLRDGWSRD